jgi:hypothetical protein
MKFQTNTCPLCESVCRLRQVAGVSIFSCPTQVEGFAYPKSHYEVSFDQKSEAQRIVVYPYSIDSFHPEPKSRVYYTDSRHEDDTLRWKLLMEVPLIRPENEVKLRNRLDKLLTFL